MSQTLPSTPLNSCPVKRYRYSVRVQCQTAVSSSRSLPLSLGSRVLPQVHVARRPGLCCYAQQENSSKAPTNSRVPLTARRNRVTAQQLGFDAPKKKPPPELPPPPPPPPMSERILTYLGLTAGLNGTLAVAIAYFYKIDPFGNWHWDVHDILLATLLFTPVFVHDLVVLLPKWEKLGNGSDVARMLDGLLSGDPPVNLTKKADDASPSTPSSGVSPSSTAQPRSSEGSTTSSGVPSPPHAPLSPPLDAPLALPATSKPDTPLGLAGSNLPARQDSPPGQVPADAWGKPRQRNWASVLRFALQRAQDAYVLENTGQGMTLPVELGAVCVNNLAREMLFRGVVLALLAGWCTDRLYEAGAPDDVSLLGLVLPTQQAGAWAAVALSAGVGLLLLLRRTLQSGRGARLALVPLNKTRSADSPQVRIVALNDRMASSLALSALISGSRDMLEVVCAGSAFVVTGNLAAPFVAMVAAETVLTLLQRRGFERYKQDAQKLREQTVRRMRELRAQAAAKHVAAVAAQVAATEAANALRAELDEAVTSSSSPLAAAAADGSAAGSLHAAAPGQPHGTVGEENGGAGVEGGSADEDVSAAAHSSGRSGS